MIRNMTPNPTPSGRSAPVSDAPPGNWADRYAPEYARPYLRLARLDRPIGRGSRRATCGDSEEQKATHAAV